MHKKANTTSFKKGHVTWNSNQRIAVVCKPCGKLISVPPYRLKAKTVSCSRACARQVLSEKGTAAETMKLFAQGLSAQEIAGILKRPVATIYSHMNRRKYRFRQVGLSRAAVTNRFLKGQSCAVCGWMRCLDAAHIIPASKGGTMEASNLLPLCPNHHRLFDAKLLTDDEIYRIEEFQHAREFAQAV